MRITISQRVAIVLLISISLLIILILWNGAAVSRYRANTRTLSAEVLPELENISTLRQTTSRVVEETLHFLLTGKQEYSVARSAAALDVLRILAIIGDAPHNNTTDAPEEQAVLGKVDAQARALLALTDTQVSFARRNNNALNLNAVIAALDASREQLSAALDTYADLLRQERFAVVVATEQDPLQVTRVLGAIALLVLIFQYVASRVQLFRPLLRLRNAALAVAAGDRRPLRVDSNDEIGDLGRAFNAMIERVSAQEQALHERAATLEEANAAQQRLLDTVRALDVPVIPVGEGVLALPLVGTVDAARADQLTQRLLDTVYHERADTVLLDVTGLASADGDTARYLLDTAHQLRLLGARTIVTGIRADLAHTLAILDLDVRALDVRATLREGIADALTQPMHARS